MDLKESISRKYGAIRDRLDERGRRIWAAAEVRELGWGGQTLVSEATGLARHTIRAGLRELEKGSEVPSDRVRAEGGGRPKVEDVQVGLVDALESLVSPETRGDPESPLLWTTKSLRHLAEALAAQGFGATPKTVARLLRQSGYSLQSTRKKLEGTQHVDRDAQFQRIHSAIEEFRAAGEPVISVDAKKKELVGDFAQQGREWRPAGKPVSVRVHDFIDAALGKVVPYGVFDVARNTGWVNVGVSADTGDFAVMSIRRWWERLGVHGYPNASRLLITADGGGSNGYRLRAWKVGLQALADDLQLPVTVMHLPPGTSKWNRIEHRMFCHITAQFRGRPLVTRETIVQLIAHTKTKGGLRIEAELDETIYPKGVRIDDDVMACLNISRDPFHGEWNYTIHPNTSGQQLSR